jgi:predicted Ser/Thr protein kinase
MSADKLSRQTMHADPKKSRTENPGSTAPGSTAVASTACAGAGAVSSLAGWAGRLAAAGIIEPPASVGQEGKVDSFIIDRELGAGGMGAVFQAHDEKAGKKVAVKFLRPDLPDQAKMRERFLREARHLQKLNHPNIVPVLAVKDRTQGPYFVMPFFEGGSLAARLKEGKPLESDDILEIAVPVAEALCHAHERGIIHGDMKPGNILLGADGSVCLADFGLARTLFDDPFLDVEGDQCEGTGPYLSPGVAKGQAEDGRRDIYGLGAVLYHALTGRPPYRGRTLEANRTQIRDGPPKPIRELNPEADPALVHVIEWAMARDLDDRYATIAHLAGDLRRLAARKTPFGPHGVGRFWAPSANLARGRVAKILLAAAAVLVGVLGWQFLLPGTKVMLVGGFTNELVTCWYDTRLARWDDGQGKRLLVPATSNLYVFSASGRLLKSYALEGDIIVPMLIAPALLGDGKDGALVGWHHGADLVLSPIRPNQSNVVLDGRRFSSVPGIPLPNQTNNVGSLVPLGLVLFETDRGEERKVMASFTTGYGHRARALCCFDWQSRTQAWRYEVGPAVAGCLIADLGRNGTKAYLCGSGAPGNGNLGQDGSDDAHASIFAFSPSGERLWRTNLAGHFRNANVLSADLDGNGDCRILAWVQQDEVFHATNGPMESRVVQLDGKGEVVSQYNPGTCLASCVTGDLEGDGSTQIICADCEGVIRVLNPGLGLLLESRVFKWAKRPKSIDRAEVNLIGIGKLRPRGKPYLVVECRERRRDAFTNPGGAGRPPDKEWQEHLEILVLDARLHVRARYPVAGKKPPEFLWKVQLADLDGDGVDEILSLTDHVEILKLR